MTWRHALLAVTGALCGCGAARTAARLDGACGADVCARPVASLSADDLQPEGEDTGTGAAMEERFPSGWGLRIGAAAYPSTTTRDVEPRALVGVYHHFYETDSARLELALDFTPDLGRFAENGYLVASAHYMGFAGSAGALYWTAGGGGIVEARGTAVEAFGMAELGAGLWIELGEKAEILVGASVQFPLGEEVNAPVIVVLNAGIDF